MPARYIILLHDDWEVRGDGLGNVADLQYLPALALMDIAEDLGLKLTFMAEVAHRLALERFKECHPDLSVQARLWDDTVRMMAERGFDVQLHLHPQWLDARYVDGRFRVGRRQNIGCYRPDQQEQLIAESVRYLIGLVKSVDQGYQVIAFKAGCWGLQPSRPLLGILASTGIHIILGVRDGMCIPNQNVDYRRLEERFLPYHPNVDDVTRVAERPNSLVVIPLQLHAADMIATVRLALYLGLSKIRERFASEDATWRVDMSWPSNQGQKKGRFRFSLRPYRTHLKLGALPFSFMKHAFDQVIKRLQHFDLDLIPIAIECHSKTLKSHMGEVRRFVTYLLDHYGDQIEFMDLRSFWQYLQERPWLVKSKAVDNEQASAIQLDQRSRAS
ncbi:MAG: hypothetical protein QHH07_06305 [Sedimentisphaerales bacterium]|nr:hypothetical protein [Sedimentisphaerales bacterium]